MALLLLKAEVLSEKFKLDFWKNRYKLHVVQLSYHDMVW